jgi:hypothetical protein
VNLAADFIDHPLKAPFERVMASVRAQQAYETTAIKNLLRSLRSLSDQFPENGEEVKTLESSIFKKADMLRQKSRDEVVPVQHSIIIEEL